MIKRTRQRRCKNCQDLYKRDPRQLKRQKFCRKPACKAASKKHSQQKWLNKPENRDHFSGPDHVTRVQEWRQDNPGYWKRGKLSKKPSLIKDALQEMKSGQTLTSKGSSRDLIQIALQDLISAKTLVFIGLDTHFNKSALQDIIDTTDQKTVKLTPNILKKLTKNKRCQHGQTIFFKGTV